MQFLEHSNLEKIEDLIHHFCSQSSIDLLKKNEFVTQYPKNSIIFEEGSPAKFVQYIKSGQVKVFTRYNGKERIIRLADKGKIIGHRSFGADNTYFASAKSLSPLKVVSFPKIIFEKVLLKNPKFCIQFLNFFAEELRISEKRVERLSVLPVYNRIAYALIMNIEYFGVDPSSKSNTQRINNPLSRKDLAGLAITTYESTVRSLRELEKQGIIKLNGKDIEVCNYEELLQLTKVE